MKKFAVFGNPIAQSLSPTIHQMFAEQVGEKISYEKILAPVDGFVDAANAFFQFTDIAWWQQVGKVVTGGEAAFQHLS